MNLNGGNWVEKSGKVRRDSINLLDFNMDIS